MSTSTPSIYLAGDQPRARATDPDTSHAAADRSSEKLSRLERIVLAFFQFAGVEGLTDSELDKAYSFQQKERSGFPEVRYETPRKRRSDLYRRHGLLEDSGLRRLNDADGFEVVWVLKGLIP